MKAKADQFPVESSSEAAKKQPDLVLLPGGDELTDEEAFYAAQEVAFAALKARHQARPRRKL
jgi:hypothetical protein